MRRTVGLLVLLAGVVLAGCGGVPTSGEIRSGNEQGAPANQPGVVQYKPGPPPERADRESIVSGFLEAMTDPANADIARLYLTKAAAASWRSGDRTTVYDASTYGKPREAPDSTVVLEARWVGSLDQRGAWQPPATRTLKHAFQLVTEGSEWRIANPPPGTMINQDQLTLVYGQYNLYFFNAAMDQLVPDPVYLPRTGTVGQVATRLTEALLKGPTSRLGADVVKTAAPPNAKFNVSVPVEAGVASVALDEAVSRLGVTEKEQLAAQITWTLRPVATEVKLTAADVPLVEGGAEVRTTLNYDRYDPLVPTKQLYVAVGHDIAKVNLSDGVASQDSSIRSSVSDYTTDSFAVDLKDQPTVAVVSNGNVVIGKLTEPKEPLPGQEEPVPDLIPVEGKTLRPSFDEAGNLWIADRADNNTPRIQFVTPNQGAPGEEPRRETYEVEVPGLAGKQVNAIRVAPDGVRVLLATKSKGVSSVYLAGAIRNGDQITLRLGRPVPVPMTEVVDLGWSAADKFMVLGNNGRGVNQVREMSVDGSTDPLQGIGPPTSYNPVYLAIAPSTDALLVVGDDPGLIRIRGSDFSWRDSLTLDTRDKPARASHPVYPG